MRDLTAMETRIVVTALLQLAVIERANFTVEQLQELGALAAQEGKRKVSVTSNKHSSETLVGLVRLFTV